MADARRLLQDRLSLFGRWFFFVALAYYAMANLPFDWLLLGRPFDWLTEWLGPNEQLVLGVVACGAALWVVTGGSPRSMFVLLTVDALAVIAPLAIMAGAILQARGGLAEIYSGLFGCANLVVVRAIVVPSTAWRTVVLSAVAWVPVVVATAVSVYGAKDVDARTAMNVAQGSALWGAVAVACAGVSSRILFRLRVEVADARRLGQYTLRDKIGQGAVGVVYRADHALLRRPTAVKLLAAGKNSAADLRRFEREVQMTARLTHPNTVAIYDYGLSPEGVFYYAMEYVDGVSFEELVAHDGPQPAWRVIHMLRQVCGALEEAHRVKLIHRDIKPANLMLCVRGGVPDVVKVLDFGLVKPVAPGGETGEGGASIVDDVVGTPLYMSPEAIGDPAAVDHRSDVYSLGATAYFLLAGTPPFSGRTVVQICSKHLGEKPESLSAKPGASVPADLDAVVLRCLAKDPKERPAGAAELEALLSACAAAGEWSVSRVAPWWEKRAEGAQAVLSVRTG